MIFFVCSSYVENKTYCYDKSKSNEDSFILFFKLIYHLKFLYPIIL